MNFNIRSNEPELMDNEGNEDEIISALVGLKLLNKYLGGNTVTLQGIKDITGKYKLSRVKILDAGSGSSDVLHQRMPASLNVTSFDKNKVMCNAAKDSAGNDNAVCGNVFQLPFKEKSFDVVHASLFFHHFRGDELPLLLRIFCGTAVYGVVINDLQRSPLAYLGFKFVSILFSGNRLVRHDGLISVKRGFKENELTVLLDGCGFRYKIKKKWAFRWLIIIYCNERV